MFTFLDSLLTSGQPVLDPAEQKPAQWIQRQLSTRPPKITTRLQQCHLEHSLEFPGPNATLR